MTREKRKLYLEKRELRRQKRKQKRRFYAQKKGSRFSPLAVFLACLALLALLAAVAVGVVNAVVISSASDNMRDLSADDGYTVAVIFGAKVHEGGTLSAMLEDRMSAAVALYREGKVQKLLVSGDGRGEWSETKFMKLYATENGVPEADIIEDGEGFSTIETVTRAKEVFGLEKCVLVTQKYHLYRAIYAAESMGMDVVGINSDPRKYIGQFYREVREVLARVKDFALCINN